jgi:hypothetical protein
MNNMNDIQDERISVVEDRASKIGSAIGLNGLPPTPTPFPPEAMTDSLTNIAGVNYICAAASDDANFFKAFNKSTADVYTTDVDYDSTTGVFTGTQSTLVNGVNTPGQWMSIISLGDHKMIDRVVITPSTLAAEVNLPRDFKIISFDGTHTTVVDRTNVTDWTTAAKTFTFDAAVLTKQLILIVTRVGNSNSGTGQNCVALAQIEYFEALPYVVTKTDMLEERIAVVEASGGGGANAISLTPVQQKSALGIVHPRLGVFSDSNTAVLPEGTYTANRSSTANGTLENANAAFDYVDNTVWSSANNTYDATNGVYIGAATTLVDGAAVLGEWLEISLPMSIKAEKINISATKRTPFDAQTRSPRNFVVAAFVNNSWTSVLQHTNALGWTLTQTRQFALASPVSSNGYRLIVEQIGNDALYSVDQHRVEIEQLTFETALTSALDDVREKDAHLKKVMGYNYMPEVWKSGGDETTTPYAQGSMALDQTVRLSLATGVTIAQELGTEPSLATQMSDNDAQLKMALGYDLMPAEFKTFPTSIDDNLYNAVLGTSQRTSTAGLQVLQLRAGQR